MNNLMIWLALSFTQYGQSMSALARKVEENELLIKKHRGIDRLKHLEYLGVTTVRSYSMLIDEEADQIKRELIEEQIKRQLDI
jgi:hypothetical protein